MIPEKYWDDAKVGDECTSSTYEMTEARVMAYADLTGDHTPVHTDEAYAKTTSFGTRVAHGLFGLSVADGLKTTSEYRFLPGMSLGWTWDFLGPIKLGDTMRMRFRVGTMRESKSKPGWGIVVLPSELTAARAWVAAQPGVVACLAALDAIDVPGAKVQSIDEVLADPQIIARGMVVEQDHPVLGKIRMPNLPFRLSDYDTSPKSIAPSMGQHNRELAAEAGYSTDEIDAMVRDGVLYSPEPA